MRSRRASRNTSGSIRRRCVPGILAIVRLWNTQRCKIMICDRSVYDARVVERIDVSLSVTLMRVRTPYEIVLFEWAQFSDVVYATNI